MYILLLVLTIYIQNIDITSETLSNNLPSKVSDHILFGSTVLQTIQTGAIICIPANVQSIKAILLYLSSENHLSPKLKSLDGTTIIYFTLRAYLYVQLSPPLLSADQRCFQVDLDSTNVIGQIQFIYQFESREANELSTPFQSVNPCLTRRIKCKNGGQCQVLFDGQTKCLCPDHISGNDCENIGIRCTNIICINQGICSDDQQSCICPLGTQGRDCSVRCGESYIQPNISSDRIINGQTAVKNSWPYIVYIQIGGSGWCSGSLIDPWTVLTAAHCTYRRELEEFILWFGVHNLDEREMDMNMGIVEKRFLQAIIDHPNYKTYPIKNFENDLSILRLSQSVEETAFIRYLCVIPNDARSFDVQLNNRVEIIGWGYINKYLSNGTFLRQTNELQQASIQILPDSDCLAYKKNNLPLFQSKYMICAGTLDYQTDACQGDSGGPLLMEYNHRWYAVGIVSFGSSECAKIGSAGVYTRLSVYSNWIYKNMN